MNRVRGPSPPSEYEAEGVVDLPTSRSEKAFARSEARFDRETAKYGRAGIGYPDGVWFLATSEHGATWLDKHALRMEGPWPAIALDAVGPVIGNRRLRPNLYVQIRRKYLHVSVDERGEPFTTVDAMLVECLRDLGVEVTKELRLPQDIEEMQRWA